MNDSLEAKFQCRYDGCDKTYSHKTNKKRYEETCKKKSFDLPQQKDVPIFIVQKLGTTSPLKQSLIVKNIS